MATTRATRPANRPSRRHEIFAAAVELLAANPPDQIAVSDIAAQANMTPAAFYYHFGGKDEILNEIVAGVAERWDDCVTEALGQLTSTADIPAFIEAVLDWIDEHENSTKVYFVTSIGATSRGEAVRKTTRDDLSKKAAKVIAPLAPAKDKVEVASAGVALIALLDSLCRARLEPDASYRTLGPVRFRSQAVVLAEFILR